MPTHVLECFINNPFCFKVHIFKFPLKLQYSVLAIFRMAKVLIFSDWGLTAFMTLHVFES